MCSCFTIISTPPIVSTDPSIIIHHCTILNTVQKRVMKTNTKHTECLLLLGMNNGKCLNVEWGNSFAGCLDCPRKLPNVALGNKIRNYLREGTSEIKC